MGLSKRIALSLGVILITFLVALLFFSWSAGTQRRTVAQLQSVTRAQVLLGDLSDRLTALGKTLRVLDAMADARSAKSLDFDERTGLLRDVQAIQVALGKLDSARQDANVDPLAGANAVRLSMDRWEQTLEDGLERFPAPAPAPEPAPAETPAEAQPAAPATGAAPKTPAVAAPGATAPAAAAPAEPPANVPSEAELQYMGALLAEAQGFVAGLPALIAQLVTDGGALRAESVELNNAIDAVEARFRTVSIAVFAGTVALSLVLAWWLLRYTRRSLRALKKGTTELGEGRLDYRIQLDTRDELGAVAHAFNGMAERLKAALDQAQNAQARADNANKAKSAFLANMSHELRTPMNAIIGYSEMMLETIEDGDELDPDEAKGDLGKIRGAGKHLLALINDVLDLAKVEAGKMTLFVEKVDGNAVLGDIESTVKPLMAKRDNKFRLLNELGAPDIHVDVTKFRQILLNLLSNAAKFTDKGTITLHASRFKDGGRDSLRLAVTDSGIGMNEAQLAKVFEEFSQAEASTSKDYGGTGLGLAICKKFAALMGGDITVKSKPGVGTTFTFVVPADGPPGQEAPEPITAAVASAIATVLVVDDDESSRELSKRILEKEGYRVITADNGITGVSLAREHKPAAIVLDVVMPGMDGWQVLGELSKDASTKDIPVVMQSMLQQEELGEALGADEFLQKPVDRVRLTEAIKKLLPAAGEEASILIVEEGSALTDKLREAMDGNPWKLESTADLAHAGKALDERAFSAVLIGFHSNNAALGAFMRRVSKPGQAPMLLMDSVGKERNNAEHLLGFIKEQVGKKVGEPA